MGYSTYFNGSFSLNKKLSKEHYQYLYAFCQTRHMKRYAPMLKYVPDPLRQAVSLPLGTQGCFYIGNPETDIQAEIDYNSILEPDLPPKNLPGLWCQWVPSKNGKRIEWDGCGNFHNYINWLGFIVIYFLQPWGYVISGRVEYQGDEPSDFGTIVVKNNELISFR